MYLTLPCSASRREYSENRIGHYTTLLSRPVELDGTNEIGLCEILLPVPKLNLSDETITFTQTTHVNPKPHKFTIPVGVTCLADLDKVSYPTADELGNEIFFFTFQDETLSLSVLQGWSVKFHDDKLSSTLGFASQKEYRGLLTPHTKYRAAMNKASDLAYIYCDVCQYSVVGDEMAPVLRSVPLVPHRPTIIRFENIHYVPLTSNRIRTIEIEVCSDLGDEIRFTEGVSYVKLHIRSKK